MRSSLLALTLVGSSLAILAACGGGTPAANAPTPAASASSAPSVSAPASASAEPIASAAPTASAPPAASASAVVAPPAPWSDSWSLEQKVAFMKQVVVPKMQPIFQGADPKKYADFSCKTCHGPDKKEPPKFLPHLAMKGGKLTAFAEKPQVSKFMMEKVSPAMADALGLPHFDMKTHQGFGCAGCHTIDQK